MASSSSSADGSCVPWDGGGQQKGGQQKGAGHKGARQKGAQQQQVSWLPEEDRKEEDGRKQSSSGQPTGKGRPFPVMFGLGKGGSDSDESETPDFENPCCHLGESGTDAFQPRAGPSHWLGTPPPLSARLPARLPARLHVRLPFRLPTAPLQPVLLRVRGAAVHQPPAA